MKKKEEKKKRWPKKTPRPLYGLDGPARFGSEEVELDIRFGLVSWTGLNFPH